MQARHQPLPVRTRSLTTRPAKAAQCTHLGIIHDYAIALAILRRTAVVLSPPRGCALLVSGKVLQRHDCFTADTVRRLADGTLELSKGTIRVRVARTFPIEASPDGKPHFCVWDSGYGLEARCVFLPVGS